MPGFDHRGSIRRSEACSECRLRLTKDIRLFHGHILLPQGIMDLELGPRILFRKELLLAPPQQTEGQQAESQPPSQAQTWSKIISHWPLCPFLPSRTGIMASVSRGSESRVSCMVARTMTDSPISGVPSIGMSTA